MDILFLVLLAVLLLLFWVGMGGCMTPKNLPKHNDKFPPEASSYAAKHFPCLPGDTVTITEIDSADYTTGVAQLWHMIDYLGVVNDSLLDRLNNAKDPEGHPDTACNKYIPVITGLRSQIADLKTQLQNVKPKIEIRNNYIPVKDSAESNSLRLQLNQANADNTKLKERLNWWKTFGLILAGIVAVAAAFKIGTSIARP